MPVIHDLENDVLVAIAEGRSEEIRTVGRRGSVEYHGSIRWIETGADGVPFGVGSHNHGIYVQFVFASDSTKTETLVYVR